MVDLKKTQSSNTTTDMDDLETLFSSLDGNYIPSVIPSCSNTLFSPPPPPSCSNTLFSPPPPPSCSNTLFSPPPPPSCGTTQFSPSLPPPKEFMFRPRANSVPPITLSGTTMVSELASLSASRAQQMRFQFPSVLPQLPTQSAIASPSPLLPVPSSAPQPQKFMLPVPSASTPLPEPKFTPSASALQPPTTGTPHQDTLKEPMPIPSYMPIKSAKQIFTKYKKYLTTDLVGRVAVKLARSTYFGESVLAQSTITGNLSTRPLDPRKMEEMKAAIRERFPNTTEEEFECIWTKCVESVARACNYVRKMSNPQ